MISDWLGSLTTSQLKDQFENSSLTRISIRAQPMRDDVTLQRRLLLAEPYLEWPLHYDLSKILQDILNNVI